MVLLSGNVQNEQIYESVTMTDIWKLEEVIIMLFINSATGLFHKP